MSNKTSKKSKKKKYSTRLEKNKNIYYKSNSLSSKKDNKKQAVVLLLVISIIINSILLLVINSKNNSINKLNDNLEKEKINYNKEIKTIKDNYINYLFLGDSITEFYDLDKHFPNMPVVNSGISGNTTEDILNDMKNRVYDYNPSKIFLLIGTNDLRDEKSVDEVVDNIKKIIEEIKANRKEAEIYLESIYPVNEKINKKVVELRNNPDINEINDKVKKYAEEQNITYIDLHKKLVNDEGLLDKKYTRDGLHLNEEGYKVVTEELMKYLK